MRRIADIISIFLVVALAGPLIGQQATDKTGEKPAAARGAGSTKREAKARAATAVTPEREAAVMTFVLRNHVELGELLTHLKSSQSAEYERAVREIFRNTERLALIQERDPEQYDLEVALWKAQSRVQLLTAKLKMGASDDLQQELRSVLGVQADARLALLKHDREKAADRLARIERDISQLENDRESVIDKQLQLLTKAAAAGNTKIGLKNVAKQGKKNAAQTGAKTGSKP